MHFFDDNPAKLKYNHYVTYARDLDVLKESLSNGFVHSYLDKARKVSPLIDINKYIPPVTL